MSITVQAPFKASPRITEDSFLQRLEAVDSFSTPLWRVLAPTVQVAFPTSSQDFQTPQSTARWIYRYIVAQGHDPGVWLAICAKEHSYGTNRNSVLWRNLTHSWTNARSVRFPGMAHEIIADAVRGGPYVRYRSVTDSIIDGLFRIDQPGYAYEGKVSLLEIFLVWTEGDGPQYAAFVAGLLTEWTKETPPVATTPYDFIFGAGFFKENLIGKLATNPRGGPKVDVPLNQKRGVVVHYNGPATSTPGRDFLFTIARYHTQEKDWSSDGSGLRQETIAYHIGILGDGSAYLMAPLEKMLWHCGESTWNRYSLAIFLPIGGSQHATPQQLEKAEQTMAKWLAFTGESRSAAKGHQELSSTSCPGTLMLDLVQPFRAGSQIGEPVQHHIVLEVPGYGTFWVNDEIYEAWLDEGGSSPNGPGLPISGEVGWTFPDGSEGSVQWFERSRLEKHRDKHISQGRIGDELMKALKEIEQLQAGEPGSVDRARLAQLEEIEKRYDRMAPHIKVLNQYRFHEGKIDDLPPYQG